MYTAIVYLDDVPPDAGGATTLVLASDARFSGWRALVLMCALPGWLAFAGLWLLHESPRWLLSRGRADDALAVLRAVAETNGRKLDRVAMDNRSKGLSIGPPESLARGDREIPFLPFYRGAFWIL